MANPQSFGCWVLLSAIVMSLLLGNFTTFQTAFHLADGTVPAQGEEEDRSTRTESEEFSLSVQQRSRSLHRSVDSPKTIRSPLPQVKLGTYAWGPKSIPRALVHRNGCGAVLRI